MRIGIFADTHDHLDHIRLAVSVFNELGCEHVLFAGDLVSTLATPPLRKLNCPITACYGDNEGNKPGLQAGFTILGTLAEPPVHFRSPDGVRFVIAHMLNQIVSDSDGQFEVAVYGHTHRPRIHHDSQGRLFINPGETSGWTFQRPTVAVLETSSLEARIIDLVSVANVMPGGHD